jgi:glucans biosynthesis protein
LPFEIQLFHRGYLYTSPVRVHRVNAEGATRLVFDPGAFDYGAIAGVDPASLTAELDFAGFRAHYALNRDDYKDEVVAFLGASYFRLLSRGQVYGISARGLAIDTAEERGEEFPLFREFWIEEPSPDAKALRIHALLDSKSVAGAYQFDVAPGDPTSCEVRAVIFARSDVGKIGLAPLTSMFLFGEDRVRRLADYRPEVHDSDSLAIAKNDGSWCFRPLRNPAHKHRVTRFEASGIRGFGLLQRDREIASYEDFESRFERRPSYWVTPQQGFENGVVELVEIPADFEIHDNVAAYFVPAHAPRQGERIEVGWRLRAYSGDPPELPPLRCVATRVHEGSESHPSRLIVDFEGDLAGLGGIPAAEVQASAGEVFDVVVERDPSRSRLRVAFRLNGDDGRDVDLRLRLLLEDREVGETWLYSFAAP